MSYAVAVDAGGTSTRCVVVASGGCCLGYSAAGRGNPVSAGVDLAVQSFGDCIGQALVRAGVAGESIDAVVFSMAGGIVGQEMTAFVARLRAMGIDRRPVVKGDLLGSFCSGTPELGGYALICGTGAGAARIEGGAIVAVGDSLGWLLGDNGSGFWIGRRVARAAFADMDGSGPETALTTRLLEQLGLPGDGRSEQRGWAHCYPRPSSMEQALRLIYAMRPVEVSQFSRLAFGVDDPVARRIVADAAAALARTLTGVVAPEVAGPVVMNGGVVSQNPDFVAAVRAAADVPATEYVTVTDGVVGAAVLALRELGETVGELVFDTIVSTLDQVRQPRPS